MPQFICLMKPTGNPRESADYGTVFKRHGAFLNELAERGQLIFAGYTDGETPGELSLAVLSAESRSEATTIMTSAPAVSAHLLSLTVEPFEVFLSRKLEG